MAMPTGPVLRAMSARACHDLQGRGDGSREAVGQAEPDQAQLRDRIAGAFDLRRIGVADRHPEIPRIPRPRRKHQRAQIGAFLDQRVDPLLRQTFCQIHGWLHRQERPRRAVHAKADPVVPGLGRPNLRGFHKHHALRRVTGRQRIHHGFHVRRPPCVREVVRRSTFPLFLRWAG